MQPGPYSTNRRIDGGAITRTGNPLQLLDVTAFRVGMMEEVAQSTSRQELVDGLLTSFVTPIVIEDDEAPRDDEVKELLEAVTR
jgi:hypothetical protein